ncbi:hypothetical protein AB0C84_43530 [Actinomadura sp. NPDC048955]|uniref:hypothetical protein n=1 Tax=Actinomadura sp. NPDC048955 TaxID=3158228 RepID=UPI0033E42B5D
MSTAEPDDAIAPNTAVVFVPADPHDPTTYPSLLMPDGRRCAVFEDRYGVLNIAISRDRSTADPPAEIGSIRLTVGKLVVHEDLVDLPGWDEMSDYDRGWALLHVYERDKRGTQHALTYSAPRFADDPRLSSLSAEAASAHATKIVSTTDEIIETIGEDEYDRLIAVVADPPRACFKVDQSHSLMAAMWTVAR